MKSFNTIISLIILSTLTFIPSPARAQDNTAWSIGAAPSVLIPDSDFFDAGVSPGFGAVFNLKLNRSFGLDQRFEYFYAPAGNDNFEIFNNTILLQYYPMGRAGLFPIFSAGFAFLSANPPAASGSRRTFKPTQTIFCLGAETGLIYSGLSENGSLSATISLLATPYNYRIYSFDKCGVKTSEAQLTNMVFRIGILYQL